MVTCIHVKQKKLSSTAEVDTASRMDCISFKKNEEINNQTNTKPTNQNRTKITTTKPNKHKPNQPNKPQQNKTNKKPKIRPKPTKQKTPIFLTDEKGTAEQ